MGVGVGLVRSGRCEKEGWGAQNRPPCGGWKPWMDLPTAEKCCRLPTLHPLLNGVGNGLGIAGSQVGWVHSATRALQRESVGLGAIGERMDAAWLPSPVRAFSLQGWHRPLVARLESCCSSSTGGGDQRAKGPTWLRAAATAVAFAPYFVTASTAACANCWVRFAAGASVAAVETASVLPAEVALAII